MIYRHGNVWLDSVTLQMSVGKPLQDLDPAIPAVPAPTVKAVQAVVTRRCNLSCSYCNVMLSGDSQADMNEETASMAIDAAQDAPGGRLMMVTGGEPLLVPETTFRILASVDSPKILFTNATLVTVEIASELKRMDVSPVVSMDGSEKVHNTYRCDSWSAAAEGLDLLREAGVSYGISTVVGHHNWKNIYEEMDELNRRFMPVSMGFNILHWTPGTFDPVSARAYTEAIGKVFIYSLKHGLFVDQIARRIDPLITGIYRHRDCAALGGKIVFHPDGRKSNCINGRKEEDWSRWIPANMEYCSDCPAAGICGGGCAWDGIHLGHRGKPDNRHCMWVKHILNLFMEDVEANFPDGLVSRADLKIRYRSLTTRGISPLAGSIGH
ncbi:MAG: radical SAM protein [Candidatus Fermentibacteria bacterium]|nr:radical SAM protein [Candidatus Fermentibacteria bacterium]